MQIAIPQQRHFQKTVNGAAVDLVVLENNNVRAAITNYGARWVSFVTRDKRGNPTDVITGFDSIDGYLNATEKYYGATVGRCANRIRNGSFHLDAKQHQLSQNKGINHLHGGFNGFHAAVWTFEKADAKTATLFYASEDGEEGYPGNMQVRITYTLTDADALQIDYQAETDKPTIINLTNHAFFNLNGQGTGDILEHALYINADTYTPMDRDSIVSGAIAPVENTPFDFRNRTAIGQRINARHVQLENGRGYDHNFVLNKKEDELAHAATAIGDRSGIRLDVFTTEPGMQLYTGNFMDGSNRLKSGAMDKRRTAFCLETQHFPDAPNHPNFPPIVLHPGETFRSTSVYRFSVAG